MEIAVAGELKRAAGHGDRAGKCRRLVDVNDFCRVRNRNGDALCCGGNERRIFHCHCKVAERRRISGGQRLHAVCRNRDGGDRLARLAVGRAACAGVGDLAVCQRKRGRADMVVFILRENLNLTDDCTAIVADGRHRAFCHAGCVYRDRVRVCMRAVARIAECRKFGTIVADEPSSRILETREERLVFVRRGCGRDGNALCVGRACAVVSILKDRGTRHAADCQRKGCSRECNFARIVCAGDIYAVLFITAI